MPERNAVLAVDPGGATGWAIQYPGGGQSVYESAGFDAFVEAIGFPGEGYRSRLSVIVCERYTITAETLRKSRQTTALEVIGFLKSVALQEGIPFVLQSPGDAKGFATNDRLKSAGWYQKGMDHGNDALRHLMLYMVKNQLMEVPR